MKTKTNRKKKETASQVSQSQPQGDQPQALIGGSPAAAWGGDYRPTPMQKLLWHSYVADLQEANPNPEGLSAPKAYLERLFRPDEMVCAGIDYKTCKTAPIGEFGELWGARHVVANPMTAREGYTMGDPKRGIEPRLSPRSKANTGRTRYMVYQPTFNGPEDQALAIISLARHAPLSMVVEGERGWLEAWFYVEDWPIKEIKKFQTRLVRLGSTWNSRNICQLWSLPLGVNWSLSGFGFGLNDIDKKLVIDRSDAESTDEDTGNDRHKVLYFDPPTFNSVAG